jgi:hypothetical protein
MEKPAPRFLLCILVLLFSCSDRNPDPGSSLNGNWELRSAKVNGRATERLHDLYFIFSDEGMLYTNLLGSDQAYPFTQEDDRIIQSGESTIEYHILELLDTSLILSTQIEGADFEFVLYHSPDY